MLQPAQPGALGELALEDDAAAGALRSRQPPAAPHAACEVVTPINTRRPSPRAAECSTTCGQRHAHGGEPHRVSCRGWQGRVVHRLRRVAPTCTGAVRRVAAAGAGAQGPGQGAGAAVACFAEPPAWCAAA